MEQEALKKKYFPRVPWGDDGPVRRVYFARGEADVLDILLALAEREGFTEPGQITVLGGGPECLAAFRRKADGEAIGMVFGTETAAHFCDIAVGLPDGDGWRRYIVRSEEGENLTALAHNLGVLRFRKA